MSLADYWICPKCEARNHPDRVNCPRCWMPREQINNEYEACEEEDKLHYAIIDECKAREWKYFHGSLAHRTKRTLGEPDFTIMCDRGRVLFIEAKAKNRKPSLAQLAVHAHARKLGHTIHIVRSIEQFKDIAENL